MEVLLNRRSCRMFDPEQKVPKEDLQKIIETAQNYPCAIGAQEADFVVVSNKELLYDLSEKLRLNIQEFKGYLSSRITDLGVKNTIWCDAPTVVFLVSNREQTPFREINMGEAALDVIAAAESMGYSTLPVLMCANPDASEYTAAALNVPKEKIGLSIAIGKAKPEWKNHVAEKKIKSTIHYIE